MHPPALQEHLTCKLGVINQLKQSQEKGKALQGAGPVSSTAASQPACLSLQSSQQGAMRHQSASCHDTAHVRTHAHYHHHPPPPPPHHVPCRRCAWLEWTRMPLI